MSEDSLHHSSRPIRVMSEKDKARFWSKVIVRGDDDCWGWSAAKYFGYGAFWVGDGNEQAHRVSYTLLNGAIPVGMIVCHHCDNRECTNPKHLFLGIPKDNNWDTIKKGRTTFGDGRHFQRRPELIMRGERNPEAKLTWCKAKEIRFEYSTKKTPQRTLAKRYGVTQAAINSLLKNKTWKLNSSNNE